MGSRIASQERSDERFFNYKGDDTMKITIGNKHLKKTVEFLSGLELSGKASRVRVKLNARLQEKLQEFSTEFQQIKTKFDELKEQEEYEALKDKLKQLDEITSEVSIVDMTEYTHLLPALKDELENYPHMLQGDNAVAHDLLLDALENGLPLSEEDTDADNNVEEAQYQEVE